MKTAVFHNQHEIVEVGEKWYEKLKRHAFDADQKRARLCLHRDSNDPLHEMIIVFHRDTIIRPHRHRNKSESFHIIFGELDIVIFDDAGQLTRIISMGEAGSGKSHVYRLSGPIWHSVIVRSEFAAIHEVTNGPHREEENDFAPWAPTEPMELRSFLADAVERYAQGRRVEPNACLQN
ncbi:MAG TPA: WbuC family cupin fold metalloprotein [Chthoniobacterales bacterium]